MFVCEPSGCVQTMFFIIGPEPEKAEMILFENGKLRLPNRCDFLTWGFKSSRYTHKLSILALLWQISIIHLCCLVGSWSVDWQPVEGATVPSVKDDHSVHTHSLEMVRSSAELHCSTSESQEGMVLTA